jgi:hypothetical protein
MFNKSVIVAIAALRVASSTSDQYIRNLGSILFALVQRFYEARMEEAQMRLAPLSRPPKNPSNCGAPFRIRTERWDTGLPTRKSAEQSHACRH